MNFATAPCKTESTNRENTYIYCSAVENVNVWESVEDGEGAVKVEGYHWDKSP